MQGECAVLALRLEGSEERGAYDGIDRGQESLVAILRLGRGHDRNADAALIQCAKRDEHYPFMPVQIRAGQRVPIAPSDYLPA